MTGYPLNSLAATVNEPTSSSSSSGSEDEDEGPEILPPWMEWFHCQPGHEYFCEVAVDYILDRFNLTGLPSSVPHFKQALERMTFIPKDLSLDEEEEEEEEEEEHNAVSNHVDRRSNRSDPSIKRGRNKSDAKRSMDVMEDGSPSFYSANRNKSSQNASHVPSTQSMEQDAQGGNMNDSLDESDPQVQLALQQSSIHLYGLIHSRFIITSLGLSRMVRWLHE